MSIASLLARSGVGSWGDIAHLITRGLDIAVVIPSTTTGVSAGQLLINSGHLMLRADSGSVNLRTKGPELMLVTT